MITVHFGVAQTHYTGTEQEWAAITIGDENEAIVYATIHYNYVPEE